MNLFYHTPSKTWVDMQIMYENLTAIGLDRKVYKRYLLRVINLLIGVFLPAVFRPLRTVFRVLVPVS